MRTFSIFAVCATNVLIGLRYVCLIRRERISSALAMWVFFTIAVIESLVTYLSEGGRLRIARRSAFRIEHDGMIDLLANAAGAASV